MLNITYGLKCLPVIHLPLMMLFLHVGKDKPACVCVRSPLDKTATHTAGSVFWIQGKAHYLRERINPK